MMDDKVKMIIIIEIWEFYRHLVKKTLTNNVLKVIVVN